MNNDITDDLCYYDLRNLYMQDNIEIGMYDDREMPIPRVNCSCDNCFYGRDRLAVKIIELEEEIERLKNINNSKKLSKGGI